MCCDTAAAVGTDAGDLIPSVVCVGEDTASLPTWVDVAVGWPLTPQPANAIAPAARIAPIRINRMVSAMLLKQKHSLPCERLVRPGQGAQALPLRIPVAFDNHSRIWKSKPHETALRACHLCPWQHAALDMVANLARNFRQNGFGGHVVAKGIDACRRASVPTWQEMQMEVIVLSRLPRITQIG